MAKAVLGLHWSLGTLRVGKENSDVVAHLVGEIDTVSVRSEIKSEDGPARQTRHSLLRVEHGHGGAGHCPQQNQLQTWGKIYLSMR